MACPAPASLLSPRSQEPREHSALCTLITLNAVKAGKCGEVEAALVALQSRSARVRRAAAATVCVMAEMPRIPRNLLTPAGIASIVQVITLPGPCVSTRRYGVQALHGLCREPLVCRVVTRGGGVPAVLQAMRWHLADGALQAVGCGVLEYVANLEGGTGVVLEADGMATVIAAMLHHPQDAQLQQAGCSVLSTLMKALPGKAQAVELGAMEVVAEVLRRFPEEAAVQRRAMVLLWQLSALPAARAALGRLGCVQMVTTAMVRHVQDVPLQIRGCALLSQLALDDNIRQQMAAGGSKSALLHALQLDQAAAVYARQALKSLEEKRGSKMVVLVCKAFQIVKGHLSPKGARN